jgi:hypothetical protein
MGIQQQIIIFITFDGIPITRFVAANDAAIAKGVAAITD